MVNAEHSPFFMSYSYPVIFVTFDVVKISRKIVPVSRITHLRNIGFFRSPDRGAELSKKSRGIARPAFLCLRHGEKTSLQSAPLNKKTPKSLLMWKL